MRPKQEERKAKQELDRKLDEGLKETFPASDTPTVLQPVPREPPKD
jgi:hypothetical protein